jgi:hypothetical protein
MNERVRVATFRDVVELPRESRQELLERMRRLDSAAGVRQAFEAVGTSRPVRLAPADKGMLLEVFAFWLDEVGVNELPAGIFELRNALIGDQHANGWYGAGRLPSALGEFLGATPAVGYGRPRSTTTPEAPRGASRLLVEPQPLLDLGDEVAH